MKKLKAYFISDRLNQTEDVFEKAKIHLVFDFTFFMSLLAIPFIIQLYINGFWYHLGFNIFEVISLTVIYVLFKTNVPLKVLGITFVIMDSIMSAGSLICQNGYFEIQAGLWSMLLILYTFFVLGKKWGVAIVLFISLLFIGCIPFNENQISFLNLGIPSNQVLPTASGFIVFPFLLNIYIIIVLINNRISAEGLISNQKKKLEIQKEEIVSSITYASRIQHAVLPNEENIAKCIPQSFILYQPRDIVSGDFYWFHEIDKDNYIIVCGDCTGHGVPGALMTVIGSNLLTQIVTENKIYSPSQIMTELDKRISTTLKQQKLKNDYVHDGMDLALLKVNKAQKEFIYTSAKRPAIFIREKQIQELKGSKHTLGGLREEEKKFEEIQMNYIEGDMVYLFTDGYIDQFGGVNNKKFMIKRFRETLLSISHETTTKQKNGLKDTINNWIGKNQQTDDIAVIGIRF
ncbi:MAG: SpoIIE family protein phosphatase [Bacteroidetes bacterium]|nr:SpoIIE family protein phosphatase [Bacteroidota bacterium]